MISCSTCWNSDRHTDGRPMIREILEMGFQNIELGHGIRLSLMEGVQKLYDKGLFNVSSLHNFCPLPIEITRSSPDCYEFSSPRSSERERAVKLSLQTIDFAVRLNAPLVVMHLGRVLMKEVTDDLITMAKQGKQFSREYVARKLEGVKMREERAPAHLQNVKDCLARIVEYAGEKGIKLGFEGRYAFEEIPNEREALELFEEAQRPARRLLARLRPHPGEAQSRLPRPLRVADPLWPAPPRRAPARLRVARWRPPRPLHRRHRLQPSAPPAPISLPVRL
ncbi:MAG: TIM barrel protein [Chthoniobacteraceae bacterium]